MLNVGLGRQVDDEVCLRGVESISALSNANIVSCEYCRCVILSAFSSSLLLAWPDLGAVGIADRHPSFLKTRVSPRKATCLQESLNHQKVPGRKSLHFLDSHLIFNNPKYLALHAFIFSRDLHIRLFQGLTHYQ